MSMNGKNNVKVKYIGNEYKFTFEKDKVYDAVIYDKHPQTVCITEPDGESYAYHISQFEVQG